MAVSANKTSILEFTCAKLSGIAGRPVRYRVFREDGRSRFIRGSRCRNRADRLGCVSYRHQAGRPARREAAPSTTRRLALTPEVETFLAHARGILSAVEAAEAAVASTHGRARGHIRLNSGTAFRSTSWPGCYRIFSLNIRTSRSTCRSATSVSIQFSERVDVTIRVGPLHDSELIAVRLSEVRRVIAASPHYLATHGTPQLCCGTIACCSAASFAFRSGRYSRMAGACSWPPRGTSRPIVPNCCSTLRWPE